MAAVEPAGRLGTDERRISTLHRADLTEGERKDAASYHAGDVIVQVQRLSVPDIARAKIAIGLYNPDTGARLPVEAGDQFSIDYP